VSAHTMTTPNAPHLIRRDYLILAALALIIGVAAAAPLHNPGYTDAYYYYNAAARLVGGQGLTDAVLWTYLGNPTTLPAPSHLYWLPMPSFVAAVGMAIFGIGFKAAQVGFVALYIALALIGAWLGGRLGGTRRTGWLSGLVTLLSGYFLPYWFTTATFAPFAVFAALALIGCGIGRAHEKTLAWAGAGVCCGLAHLTRNDGLFVVAALVIAALWGRWRTGRAWRGAIIGVASYLLIMTPWFARNLSISGTILPAGGLDLAFARTYDDLFNYPPRIEASAFFAQGLGAILRGRGEALALNAQTFLAVEGGILIAPLMVIGLWRQRRDPLLAGFLLYMPALHLLMTLVFPFSGMRGGLFHSAAALVPFWAALGVIGLEGVIARLAKWRRWRVRQAQAVFSGAALVWLAYLSYTTAAGKAAAWGGESAYGWLDVPPGAVVMLNDPAALYYFRGISAVVIPNAPPERIAEIAARYGVTHVLIDPAHTVPLVALWRGEDIPPFLQIVIWAEGYRLYRIVP